MENNFTNLALSFFVPIEIATRHYCGTGSRRMTTAIVTSSPTQTTRRLLFIQLDEEMSRSHLDALGIKLTKFFEERVHNESVCNERVYDGNVYFEIVYEGAKSTTTVFYYIC